MSAGVSAGVAASGVAVARGVGGRRGRARARAIVRQIQRDAGRIVRLGHAALPRVVQRRGVSYAVGPFLGRRERKRRADLRRRARDRDVDGILRLSPCPFANSANYKDPAWRPRGGWWSTPEGRRRWTEDDRARKRARRATTRCLREALGCGPMSARTADAAETFERALLGAS